MFQLYYPAPVFNEDDIAIFELDATVFLTVTDDGFETVDIEYFQAYAMDETLLTYRVQTEDAIMRKIFLRAKDHLENDAHFLETARNYAAAHNDYTYDEYPYEREA